MRAAYHQEFGYINWYINNCSVSSWYIKLLVVSLTRTTQRNYEYMHASANYEDCPRCVGQACQTYVKICK